MKITHLCLACFFPDGYSYQENLLPKFHKKLGYDVEVIASLLTFGPNGEKAYMPEAKSYMNENGIHVIRLNYASAGRIAKKLQLFDGLRDALEKSNPDILFIHGCQFLDMKVVVSYLKTHSNVQVYVDNHADYTNSATNWLSKYVLHRVIWRHAAQLISPYTSRFWGVLPARVDFLVENYGLDKAKCDLLVMGADDDQVSRASCSSVRKSVREKYQIDEDDFLVVTGGKIDRNKTQTLLLMDAVKQLPENVKLLVFGSVAEDLENSVRERLDDSKIIKIGWVSVNDSYDLFSAADVVCFPGRHSVYWEQAVAMGKPLVVKRWEGTEHVDVCGNALFLDGDSSGEIRDRLLDIRLRLSGDGDLAERAREAAGHFMYSDIAKKAVGL